MKEQKTTATTYFLQTLIAKRLKLMKLKPNNALLHAIQLVLKSKHARRYIVEKNKIILCINLSIKTMQ